MGKASGPWESHTLAGRRFTCDSEDTTQITPGGKNNEYKNNGDGTGRIVQARVGGLIEGINIVYDKDRGDFEYLQELRNKGEFFDYSGTDNAGDVWAGKVQITGDMKFDEKEGTVGITLSGTIQRQ